MSERPPGERRPPLPPGWNLPGPVGEPGVGSPSPRPDRLLAFLIDWILTSLAAIVVLAVWSSLDPGTAGTLSHPSTAAQWVIGLATPLYFILPIAITGCTVGKWACRLEVRAVGGGRPPLWSAIVRWFVPAAVGTVATLISHRADASDLVAALSEIWLIACYVPIALDDQRRGLHDRVAGTVVVRSRLRQPLPFRLSQSPFGRPGDRDDLDD